MQLARLVETSRQITQTTKRLEKIASLAALLSEARGPEIETVVAFLSGTRQARLGIGYSTLSAGNVASAEAATLTLSDVERALAGIAGVSGPGAAKTRKDLLASLFGRASREEQHFLKRLLVGELRQGALEGVMLDAIGRAGKVAPSHVRRAAMLAGDLGVIARTAIEQGEAGLSQFSIQLFRPIQPMLAGTSEDVSCALDDLGEAALEYKFDGARVQVHKSGDTVAIYSRQLNDVSAAIPEVVEAVRQLPARELILDGEVLSMDPNGRPQPFQITMRRFGRRLNVQAMMSELPMMPVWFDLLHLDGAPLIDETQSRRFQQLSRLVPVDDLIPHLVTSDAKRGEEFLHDSLERGHEGVMAKALDAPYAAGARGQSWLKIKRAKTLDLVILAAEWGNGRRQGFLSNLHLGARDTQRGGFAMLGKTFKGLTDEMLRWQTEKLLKIEIARDRYAVHVQPKIVAEIAFNEIQVSTRYASGLALRFARVKRYRTDKCAADADTFETVQRLAGMASQPKHASA